MAEIFRDVGLIERYGSGVKRAIEQIKEYGLPESSIEDTSGGFSFTVFSKEYETTQKTTQKTAQKTV
jgi:ATP-dependent DNA helicase RecG